MSDEQEHSEQDEVEALRCQVCGVVIDTRDPVFDIYRRGGLPLPRLVACEKHDGAALMRAVEDVTDDR